MLSVVHLRKDFKGTAAIADLTFDLPEDQVTCLLAPSGAGKSTLLRILAGLETATAGSVLVDGEPIIGPSPKAVLVPQADTLFPHLRVREQVAFGTTLQRNRQRFTAQDAGGHLTRITDELGLASLADRFPSQLSGGQRQRVSLGRALAVQPRTLLCDEPFSALHESARHELCCVVRAIRRDFQQAILYVTHSVAEAALVGDEIWLCDGPPLQLLSRLPTPFAAERTDELVYREDFASFCRKIRQTQTGHRAANSLAALP